jgi:hypothetical protein
MAWTFEPYWCHGWNPVLLPALAMLVGPPSPVSVDGLLRKWLGRSVPRLVRWRSKGSVLLAQSALALVFGSAGLFKLVLAHGEPFAWCYSDTMRNILLLTYWVLGQDLPSGCYKSRKAIGSLCPDCCLAPFSRASICWT